MDLSEIHHGVIVPLLSVVFIVMTKGEYYFLQLFRGNLWSPEATWWLLSASGLTFLGVFSVGISSAPCISTDESYANAFSNSSFLRVGLHDLVFSRFPLTTSKFPS